MLTLSRRIDQSIVLTVADDVDTVQLAEALRQGITITLCDIGAHQTWAKIGVDAPREVRVLRSELLQRSDGMVE